MKFIIGAQPYKHNSAGVRALYELAVRLKGMGQDVSIIHPWCIPPALTEDAIVIYPESISGNPCGGKRIVRYVLNVPGKMGGDLEYAKDELLVAYCDSLAKYADGHVLHVPVIEDFFVVDETVPKTQDAVWVGKGKNTNMHPVDCEEITLDYPVSRSAMAWFLQSVGTFYTYDNFTSLIPEALRCGCRVIYLDPENGPVRIDEFKLPGEEEVKKQFETFIQRCKEKWNIN